MNRIGASLVLIATLLVPLAGADKKAAQSYAIIGGTVFRDPGFALPGAEVIISPDPEEGQSHPQMKNLRAISDARGEFAVRVPPVAMRYKIRAQAKGFHPEEKSVSVEGEERVDATFMLHPESN